MSNQPIDQLVGDAVERYLHLYGLNAPIEPKRRDAVIRPLVFGTIWRNLDVRLVVPITMTRFERGPFLAHRNNLHRAHAEETPVRQSANEYPRVGSSANGGWCSHTRLRIEGLDPWG